MVECHTAQVMFEMVAMVLDVISTYWKSSLIGVATDEARILTGPHGGLMNLLNHGTGPNIIRVWCGAHLLGLLIAESYKNLLNNDFYSVLIFLIGYLHRQQNLVAVIKSTCPKVSTFFARSVFVF